MSADLFERCLRACALCASACERVLASDPSYTSPGTEPYEHSQLALVSCASVCRLVATAVRVGDGDLELLRWCAEISLECSTLDLNESVPGSDRVALVDACTSCATACSALVEQVEMLAGQSILGGRDTDFEALEIPEL